MTTLGGGRSRDHSLPEVSLECRVGLERTTVSLGSSPASCWGPLSMRKLKSVFILTSKTLVIAKFMILTKVKLRSESYH